MAGLKTAPPYPDIFDSAVILDDEVKYNVLSKEWSSVHAYVFPQRLFGTTPRRMKANWFVQNKWLRYSVSTDSVYCAPCRFFGSQCVDAREKAFGLTSITDWSNIAKLITRHIGCNKSHHGALVAADNFKRICEGKAKDVMQQVSKSHENLVAKNREILKCIIDTIILCGNQGIALRGHGESDGNFMKILEYRSKDNVLLKEHLSSNTVKYKYTSPDIQNEIIDICGDIIVKDVVEDCNKSPCFGFIADEATDCSTMEQMALCVRFFDEKVGLREEFLGFSECGRTTGEALTDAFLENLQNKGII